MNPVGKALWYIETHFEEDISLDDIAAKAGVSRYYVTRAFGEATGRSVMRYVRERRLSEAARTLAGGDRGILDVALGAGYGSHEAFTRAFREQFGVTPESVRARRGVDGMNLTEAIRMDQTILSDLEAPRFVDAKPLLVAGLEERYTCESSAGIPAQWQRFVPHLGHVPGQFGSTAYGVRHNFDDAGSFDYICGVEVSDFSRLGSEWSRVRIPAQRYAVFIHRNHISTIRRTHATIWDRWLPESPYEPADAPDFERYDERFDRMTGNGVVEIWVPLKKRAAS